MRRIIIPYYRELVDRARELRSAGTPTEIKLWNRLKRRHVRGCDFHRQKALLRFIVDFYCCERMLAIEIDGASHDGRDDYDLHRQRLLEGHGVRFLRFTADEIDDDIDEVVRTIERWLDAHPETPGVIA